MGLRETKKERTRAQLLEAALALIERKGFEQTTIQEIADAVQVSPRTLLRYFPTKEDVVVAWVEEQFEMIVDELAAEPAEAPAFATASAVMRAAVCRYAAQNDFFLMIEKVIAKSPDMMARKAAMVSRVVGEIADLLAKRMPDEGDAGLLPELIAGSVMTATGAAIRAWMAEDGKADLVALYDKASARLQVSDGEKSSPKAPRAVA